ncbi:MAG TPA: hypothetical protein VL588_00800, partial [Bdellovibrionota bacterium]|nr:hypothetical protein [Bdellovibrionota bacterium]
MGPVQVRRVETPKEWEEFFALSTPNRWVRKAQARALDVERNPFFHHAFRYACIAIRDHKVVGRMVVTIDENRNRAMGRAQALFGDWVHFGDINVARALLEHAAQWASNRGMESLAGPAIHGRIDGGLEADDPLGDELEPLGFNPVREFRCFSLSTVARLPERMVAHAERLRRVQGAEVVAVEPLDLAGGLPELVDVMNDSLKDVRGFAPLDAVEAHDVARRLGPWIDPELILVARVRGTAAAFCLGLPEPLPEFAGLFSLPRLVAPAVRLAIKRRGYRMAALGVRPGFRS